MCLARSGSFTVSLVLIKVQFFLGFCFFFCFGQIDRVTFSDFAWIVSMAFRGETVS